MGLRIEKYEMQKCNMYFRIDRMGQKMVHFQKCITTVCDNVGRRLIYQNVQLFIGSKSDPVFLAHPV